MHRHAVPYGRDDHEGIVARNFPGLGMVLHVGDIRVMGSYTCLWQAGGATRRHDVGDLVRVGPSGRKRFEILRGKLGLFYQLVESRVGAVLLGSHLDDMFELGILLQHILDYRL